jgi:integrase/recombinase XerD
VATSPALTQQSLPGGPLWPYPNRPSTGWIAPASPGAFVKRGLADFLGFEIGAHTHGLPLATNALDHGADIAKVQEWLGHAHIATTRIRAADSPTFKVRIRVSVDAC